MANATATFQPKVPITTIRSEYPNAKIMIAVGGWGDDIGFAEMSKSDATIAKFASDIATMLTNTGADGVGKSKRMLLTTNEHCTNSSKISIGNILVETAPTTNKSPTQPRPTKSMHTPKHCQPFVLRLAISSFLLLFLVRRKT